MYWFSSTADTRGRESRLALYCPGVDVNVYTLPDNEVKAVLSQPANQQQAYSLTLSNQLGFEVEIANIGASLMAIRVPVGDRKVNVVLGYDEAGAYASDTNCMGSTLGRYANRIAGAQFKMNGQVIKLEASEEGNCLHSGSSGFHHQAWSLDKSPDGRTAAAKLHSPDGTGGFPGNVDVSLAYQLLDPFMLVLDFEATSDADTVLNLSNHAYFNLDPDASTIDTHTLKLMAEQYTPVDDALIPTGAVRPVKGTDFDFSLPRYLRDPLSGARQRLDTNFVTPPGDNPPRLIAILEAPGSDIQLLVHTTQPGFQVYTGDNLGAPFEPRQGLCIEAQNFPDAPNQAGFPSALLRAGSTYRQRIIYEFRLAGTAG